jgi:5-methylcytosine-specific restriction endonuclease McrA
MKLPVELVPKTAWNKSLSKLLPRKVWNGIRENVIRDNGKKCQICDEIEGTMSLHEIWSYDDLKHVQKLNGFILLCSLCHHVKHIGLGWNTRKTRKARF